MPFSATLIRKMETLEPTLRQVMWAILEEIEFQREINVTKTEFNDFRAIMLELAEVQKHTEYKVNELVETQKHSEYKLNELMEAQKRTEQRMEELAEAQKKLVEVQTETRQELAKLAHQGKASRSQVGGLARTMAYALENEAYRKLPDLLWQQFQLQVKERFIRTLIAGEEINFFAKAERQGETVIIVGESVLKLDDPVKLSQVDKQITAVKLFYPEPLVPLIVTHFAHPNVLVLAQQRGILVVQSFDW